MELYHVYSLFVNFGILYAVNANAHEHWTPTSPLTVPETGRVLRLAMDQNENITSGRIEVLSRSGRYRPLCADKWSINEASAACRQLGFRSGALKATKQRSSGNWQRSDLLIGEAKCNEHAQSLHDCEWINSSRCLIGLAAGVICQENKGCPAGWIAGPTRCYLIQDSVTRREFAVKKCTSAGGHLAKIETEAENHFISHAFRNESKGFILTGGVKVDGRWLWETVESLDNTAFKTDRESISYVKWFPGWQPGNVSSQPTNNKKDRCLFLSSLIEQPNGSYINVDYHFWLSEQCSFNTTKKQSSGFKYICEMAQSRNKEVGCYTGIGVDYRGPANVTRRDKRCLNWTNATEINPNTYPNTGLGDHNYCRNPDHDEAPWCWVFPGTFEFCDIPVCNNTEERQLDGNKTCSTEEFTCNNRSCIPSLWRCDMEYDCLGGEDENHLCDYSLKLFNKTANRTLNVAHVLEKYIGTTNETCARYCLEAKKYICRSFSFNRATRACMLSDKNSKMEMFRVSVSDNVYELISQLTNCVNMFVCDNKRCIPKDHECDNIDQCGDFSDEKKCRINSTSRQTQVRLNGTDNKSGRVEVSYLGEWGVVCDDDWDDRDATVVCRMLGFNGTAKATNFQHGKGSYEFLLDDVNCKGTETSIDQCKHSGWKKHDCLLFEVAGVTCSAATTGCNPMREYECAKDKSKPCISMNKVCDTKCDCANCKDEQQCDELKIKLIGGSSPSEGLVELTKGGITGTICDDHFDDIDADVVCKMLGFRSGKVVNGTQFGTSSGTIWMDDVDCNGKEDLITQCNHTGPQNQDCDHAEDVGVTCQAAREDILATIEGDPGMYSGRVILTRDGVRGTICDDHWDDKDARVICKMMGFSGGKATKESSYSLDSNLTILLDEVQCSGEEISIDKCPHAGWLKHDCSHSEDAQVSCDKPSEVALTRQTTTRVPITTENVGDTDCFVPGTQYTGMISKTENGLDCQRWLLDIPHKHNFHNDSLFPDGLAARARNYCRNPDGDVHPWCYTTSPEKRWEYCSIKKCEDDCLTVASEYTGITSRTISGHTCQRWSLNAPNSHKYHNDSAFPDGSVEEAANHCRAPDDDKTPWCYTIDANVRWEYCNVPTCAGSFDFNKACGIRPLERETRVRRDVPANNIDDQDLSSNKKVSRIIGGAPGAYGMYPWQVAIKRRWFSFLSFHSHHCGGTIIGEYWILSAAHCFRDVSKSQIIIRTGDHYNDLIDEYEQEFEVDIVIMHERYISSAYDNDIALIKVQPINGRGIVFNDYVQPACLPDENVVYKSGQRCLISGWGEQETESESSFLKVARVPIVDHAACNKLYKQSLTDNMVCAGYMVGGIDTCAGDSGGPLVCNVTGKYAIMGVTSFGAGCALANSPGVYTRVSAYVPWIKNKLRQFG